MRIDAIPVGQNPPYDINAIIEIPLGGVPINYELDKASGPMVVDRLLHTPMTYPAHYGFLPHTLSEDGDTVDILVVGQVPVMPGAIVRSRPIGVLVMQDEKGLDEKILAVPHDDLSPFYREVSSYRDLPEILIDQIGHFFEHYKEKNKWVKIVRWGEAEEAHQFIRDAIGRAGT